MVVDSGFAFSHVVPFFEGRGGKKREHEGQEGRGGQGRAGQGTAGQGRPSNLVTFFSYSNLLPVKGGKFLAPNDPELVLLCFLGGSLVHV